MNKETSFKTRVKESLIHNAVLYNSYYVCQDYLIISDAFHKKPYYIISAEKDNYLHLTGVHTTLSASAFFDKCLNGLLDENDFEIASPEQNNKSAKGSVRRKINVLPLIENLINADSEFEEDFQKNSIFCSLASSDGSCTLGFISVPLARPKTLLKGDELDHTRSAPPKIIITKKRLDSKFSSVYHGTYEEIARHYSKISHL